MKPKQELQLLRVEDAAARIAVSRAAMYRLIGSGAIPAVRVGTRGLRVSIEALMKWVKEREVVAA